MKRLNRSFKAQASRRFRSYIRQGWYVVENIYDDLTIGKAIITDYDIRHWCQEMLVPGEYAISTSYFANRKIAFKNESDRMLFLLKWRS